MSDLVLTKEQLQENDVLLYHGNGWISAAIRLFDGTEVSHAGVFRGAVRDTVAEAVGRGVVEQPWGESLAHAAYVLVYRHKDAPVEMAPVSKRVERYLGEGVSYAYESIVLLALMSLTRRAPVNPLTREFLRKVLDGATARLLDWLESPIPRKAMICSEFAYRVYDEALPEASDAFSIRIEGVPLQPAAAPFALAQPTLGAVQRAPEKGSLLDLLAGPAANAFGPVDTATSAPVRPARTPSDDELENVAEEFVRAFAMPRAPAAFASAVAADAGVRDAIDGFAVAWNAAAARATTGGTPAAFATGAALSFLARSAASFVTPGDLYRSGSLYRVGRAP